MVKPNARGNRIADRIRPSQFERPDPSRTERAAILIALEDIKSSRLYFEKIQWLLHTNRVVVIADHEGSDPNSVVNAAKKALDASKPGASKDEYATTFEEENVWIVFDTEGPQNDERRKAAKNALERIRQLRFRHAISNPTFEFWLLLHFEYSVSQCDNGDAVVKKLRKHFKDYNKNAESFTKTKALLFDAVTNSKKIFKERGSGVDSVCDLHPSTEIHELIGELVPHLVSKKPSTTLPSPRRRG